uniref:Tetratricopeptide SHNi-TPR domain-containing protein n=1 Tax=Tetraselmis sp. GSL018 TaxID=582737 RepID=A0A061R2Z8_9CHLO
MEYAWENLETARHIYSSNREALTADQKLLLAEVYECLAELSMEKEDFQTCISDCKQAKEVYSEVLPETDRRIASLHFKMALALEFMDEPEEGLSHCQTAVKMMESKLEELKSLVPGGGASSGAEDIEGVLSDLRDKESELKEVVAQNNTAKEMIKNAFAQIAGGLTGSGGAGAGGVIDLGVVGGGTGRTKITPAAAPAPAESSGPAESRNTSADTQKKPEKKKRSLEDIMGGGSGGSTTVGFGS